MTHDHPTDRGGATAPSHLPVAEIARLIGRGCRPRDVSDAIYDRRIDADVCPLIGRRRLVPVDLVPVITAVIERTGRLGEAAAELANA
jgi:hypothetical protein